jgi:hypothetical protein
MSEENIQVALRDGLIIIRAGSYTEINLSRQEAIELAGKLQHAVYPANDLGVQLGKDGSIERVVELPLPDDPERYIRLSAAVLSR